MKSLALPILISLTLIAPALAAPNNGAFQQSSAGNKKGDGDLCGYLKRELAYRENEADKRAGTPAAAKWSKLADQSWDNAVDANCSWTKS